MASYSSYFISNSSKNFHVRWRFPLLLNWKSLKVIPVASLAFLTCPQGFGGRAEWSGIAADPLRTGLGCATHFNAICHMCHSMKEVKDFEYLKMPLRKPSIQNVKR